MDFDCIITHEKSRRVLAVNDGGPIYLEFAGKYVCEIDPDDSGYVTMIKPGLLKSGSISFSDDDGDNLVYQAGGYDIMAFIEVSAKDKNSFYQMYGIFDRMGLEIKVY